MSSPDYRMKEVLGIYKNKVSINQDTIINLELSNKTNFVKPDQNIFVLNAFDQFSLERNKSNCYRVTGKLEVLTDNSIQPAFCNLGNPPDDFDWDPSILDNGSPQYDGRLLSKNWLLQITYPSDKDTSSFIKTPKNDGTIRSSKAYEGVQVRSLEPINIDGRKDQILLKTIQKHGISDIGEYIYLKSKGSLDYLGFHRVVGFENGNEDRGLILQTKYTITPSQSTEFILNRVIEPSFNDINFVNTQQILLVDATDENGQNIGPIQYIRIYDNNHGLKPNDWIDLRVGAGASVLNGLFKITKVVNNNEFLILPPILPISQQTDTTNLDVFYRILDGVPSEYYFRKFKVMTELNDYEVYKAAYSKNIFNYGYGNNINLFHFDRDIDVSGLIDNLGRPISRLYLTITRRAGSASVVNGGFGGWGTVTSLMEENRTVLPSSDTSPYILDVLSFWQNTDPLTSGTISKPLVGDSYFGDFAEYNSFNLEEKILSNVINRFSVPRVDPNDVTIYDGGVGEGYYYKQHNEIRIKEFSKSIETTKNEPNELFPSWAQINNDGTVSWRDLLSIGFFEEGTLGVDYPFVNGCHYLYDNYSIYIRRQKPTFIEDAGLNKTKFVKAPNVIGKGLGDEC
jgi:hypothetical protein